MHALADGVVELVPVDGLGSGPLVVIFRDVMCFGDMVAWSIWEPGLTGSVCVVVSTRLVVMDGGRGLAP